MHGLHGRLAVFEGRAEEDLAVPGDAFDVKDFAGHEALEEVVGLEVAELVEDWPECVGMSNFANADRGGVGARLQEPGTGNMGEETADVLVVEDGGELGDRDAALTGTDTHGQLVAEVAGGGVAPPREKEEVGEAASHLQEEILYPHQRVQPASPGGET